MIVASEEPNLSKDQIKQFLLNAKVIKSGPAHRGVTNSYRLTLADGTITHDAHFQAIDEHAATKEMASGLSTRGNAESVTWSQYMYKANGREKRARLGGGCL